MNWATVTETGTRITVPKSTVTLTIPQGAILPHQTQDIYISVITNQENLKNLQSQNLVTPLTQWGTSSNRKLLKPVVLSIPHNKTENGNLRILHCENTELDNSEWQILPSENMQVDSNFLHLVTDKTGAFCVAQEYARSCMNPSTKSALCRLLDVPTCQGNDWRKLAEICGINYGNFSNLSSPSEAILNIWETRNMNKDNSTKLVTLAQLLKDINRLDAVVILERELKK